jgi:ribosomal protein L40E
MSTCTQCGSDNPANANQCKYCQGSLKKDKKRTSSSGKVIKVYKDGDLKIHTCPECSADFSHEYESGSDDVITCPSCEQDIKYENGIVKKLIKGSSGMEYSKHEDPSINVDRFCKNCLFKRSKYKGFFYNITEDFESIAGWMLFIVVYLIIAVAPILIWPQITPWYGWITFAISFAFLAILIIAYILITIEENDKCKKLKEDTKYCNPNLRCKHWVKK